MYFNNNLANNIIIINNKIIFNNLSFIVKYNKNEFKNSNVIY